MKLPVRVGVVILPDRAWSTAVDAWQRADALGFDHAWTYDHLTWRGHRDLPWFGAIPTLAAASVTTTRIRLGPLVTSPNFRHPMPLAKDLITLDDLSRGRITLGVGAGGTGWDATMLGQQPWSAEERSERFEEFVALTDLLLREPASTSHGRFYSVEGARTHPGCVQRPRMPFAVAATGPRGMAVAARWGSTWVTTGPRQVAEPVPTDEGVVIVRRQIAALERACAQVRRDPATIDRLVLVGVSLDSGLDSPASFEDLASRYANEGVTDIVVHWPRDSDPYGSDPAVFERIFAT